MFFVFKRNSYCVINILFIAFKHNNFFFLHLNAILLRFNAKHCVDMQTFALVTQCFLRLNAIAIGLKQSVSANLASMNFRTYAVVENMYLYKERKKTRREQN